MRRRAFLKRAGAGGVAAALAGCSAEQVATDTGTEGSGTSASETEATGTTVGGTTQTLVVATYGAFVDAPSSSPGGWVKQAFESEFDAELVWQTPDSEVNYYVERANAGVDVEADAYVGLNTDMLIRVDENLESGSLFAELGDGVDDGGVREDLRFDPQGRAVPFDTGYISLVYNETMDDGSFVAPETFDGLLDADYEGDLLAQNPDSSSTGRAFLLHSIAAKGPENYLDYWSELQDNGVRVLGSWEDAYTRYTEEEAPMVVSYSTDQVFANESGADMAKHQIRFLNDQGYANPEGAAVFADADAPELAREFCSFLLRPEVQGEIAVRNVAFPATSDAAVPEDYAQYAQEPPEAVTFSYDELRGNVEEWVTQWQQQFAEG